MELAIAVLQQVVRHMEQTGSTRRLVRLFVDDEFLQQLNEHAKVKYSIEDVRQAVDKCLAHQWLEHTSLGGGRYAYLGITEIGVGVAVSKTRQEEQKAAGDKHFFRYVNKVKEDTGISLNLWGVNPLEVTHFKTGFLGIEPDFERQRVYASGKMGQLRYQGKRLQQMLKSPGYFNSSLWDTWSGEYFRSAAKKSDYFHVFDYWQWSEKEINSLLADYDWEVSATKSPPCRTALPCKH